MSFLSRKSVAPASRRMLIGVLTAIATLAPSTPGSAQFLEQQFNMFASPATPRGRPAFNLATRPDVLDLELSIQRADLVVAAKLAEITESKVVQGGRNVQVTQQYRFEPVRVIKGIFARDALLMTGQDLGVYQFAAAGERLQPGQTLLVLLARQGQHFMNCNPASSLGQSIPRLSGADDALLPAVDVLIAAARQRDRKARVQTLLDGLAKAKGREAAPLLLALDRRAVIVARNASLHKDANKQDTQESAVGHAILPLLKSDSASIRELAAHTIGSILDATPRNAAPKGQAAAPSRLQLETARAIDAALATTGPDIAARVAMIEARGLAGGEGVGLSDEQQEQLRKLPLARSSSNAEAAARFRAIARNPANWRKEEVANEYQSLLLDAPADLQLALGRALVALDVQKAAEVIPQRLSRKHDAGLDVSTEINLIAALPPATAAPALLKAWDRSLNVAERLTFAQACLAAADPRLVPALGALLDPRQWNIRALAVEALRKIDTDEAASVLRLHLDGELDPASKLRLIAFLARHNIHDGDTVALESLADANLREEAIDAVVAAAGPKVVGELQRIWQTSNDPTSNAAAFRALARLGQQDIAPRLLEIAKTPGDPLAPPALLALADLGNAEALPIVADALTSRRDAVVLNAARAGVALLKKPDLKDDRVRDGLAGLLSGADASPEVRSAALDALVSLDDPRLLAALNVAASDVNLEGSPLLARIEAELETRPESP
jgi:HEAT repeat protein